MNRRRVIRDTTIIIVVAATFLIIYMALSGGANALNIKVFFSPYFYSNEQFKLQQGPYLTGDTIYTVINIRGLSPKKGMVHYSVSSELSDRHGSIIRESSLSWERFDSYSKVVQARVRIPTPANLEEGNYLLKIKVRDENTGDWIISQKEVGLKSAFNIGKVEMIAEGSSVELIPPMFTKNTAFYVNAQIVGFLQQKDTDGNRTYNIKGKMIVRDNNGNEVKQLERDISIEGKSPYEKKELWVRKKVNTSSLSPGMYTLTLILTDNISGRTIAEDYYFRVV